MDLVTLAVAKKYTDKAIAQAAVGDIDVEAYVKDAINEVVGSASEKFNSLGEMETELGNKVDKTTTINNKALSGNISLGASDVGAVPTTRTVNGKALSGNITLSATDVKALPDTTTIPTTLAGLTEDATHRVVTDAEKTAWNAKSNFSGNYNDLTNKPTIPSVAGLASEIYVDSAIANAMILSSTTEGSTKKFRITVDDTGALTAVEVTE
jgi:hypothetical protein